MFYQKLIKRTPDLFLYNRINHNVSILARVKRVYRDLLKGRQYLGIFKATLDTKYKTFKKD